MGDYDFDVDVNLNLNERKAREFERKVVHSTDRAMSKSAKGFSPVNGKSTIEHKIRSTDKTLGKILGRYSEESEKGAGAGGAGLWKELGLPIRGMAPYARFGKQGLGGGLSGINILGTFKELMNWYMGKRSKQEEAINKDLANKLLPPAGGTGLEGGFKAAPRGLTAFDIAKQKKGRPGLPPVGGTGLKGGWTPTAKGGTMAGVGAKGGAGAAGGAAAGGSMAALAGILGGVLIIGYLLVKLIGLIKKMVLNNEAVKYFIQGFKTVIDSFITIPLLMIIMAIGGLRDRINTMFSFGGLLGGGEDSKFNIPRSLAWQFLMKIVDKLPTMSVPEMLARIFVKIKKGELLSTVFPVLSGDRVMREVFPILNSFTIITRLFRPLSSMDIINRTFLPIGNTFQIVNRVFKPIPNLDILNTVFDTISASRIIKTVFPPISVSSIISRVFPSGMSLRDVLDYLTGDFEGGSESEGDSSLGDVRESIEYIKENIRTANELKNG